MAADSTQPRFRPFLVQSPARYRLLNSCGSTAGRRYWELPGTESTYSSGGEMLVRQYWESKRASPWCSPGRSSTSSSHLKSPASEPPCVSAALGHRGLIRWFRKLMALAYISHLSN